MYHESRFSVSVLALPVCILAFFYWFVCRDFFSDRLVPGDLGDARFNIYILEHLARWLAGRDASLASPGIFYPFPGALYFSDTHFGSAFFYVIFRALGIGEYRAFTLWFFIGYLLTFAASYFVALRLGYNSALAAIIATIFSFSLPSLGQFGHSQLVYRFPVPLAFLSCWNFVRTGSVRHLLWLIVWVSLEMLCGVYLGVFLALAVVIFIGCSLLIERGWRPAGTLMSDCISDARQILRNRKIQDGFLLAVAGIAAVAAAAALAEYQGWSDLYGFKRSWREIAAHLPRPISYLVMDYLPYWKTIDQSLIHAEVPTRNEQNIFVGVGVLSFFVVGLGSIFTASKEENRLVRSALATIIVLVLLTTMFGDYSAYYFLTYIPGFDSIRAVTRISIVTMFPVALVAAEGARALMSTLPRTPSVVALLLFLTISVLEILMIEKPGFPIDEAERRISAIVEEARRLSAGKTDPILSLVEDWELPYMNHLDAMLAAQRLGWPTSNGYSGNGPPGYQYKLNGSSQAVLFDAYEQWHAVHDAGPDFKAADLLSRDVLIGSSACSGAMATFGPPPPYDFARQIRLLPGSLERHDSHLNLEVIIHSQYDRCVHAVSLAPVRLSWRFVPVGYDDAKDPMKIGWNTRLQLPGDIVPEANLDMKLMVELPSNPGTYNIEFSLVAELSFWFHDKGMEILRFDDALKVP
jgi:hypothetical protein